MKILQVHNLKNGVMDRWRSPKGGQESVILSLHELFEKNGIKSIFFESVDGCAFVDNQFDISKTSGYATYLDNIEKVIIEESPDLVIAHGTQTMVGHLAKRGIPHMFIEHASPRGINKLYFGKIFGEYGALAKSIGSKIITVSESAMDAKEKEIVRQKFPDPNFKYDGWCSLQYPTRELLDVKIVPGNGRAIAVGRSHPEKQLHRLGNHAHKLGFDFNIITPYSDTECFHDLTRRFYDNVYQLLSRAKTIEHIAESSILASTCPSESAGITAFEGACLGLPLMLNEKKGELHASRMFLSSDKYICTFRDPIERVRELINLSIKERILISEDAKENNSEQIVLSNLLKLAEGIPNPGVNLTSLSEFF